MLNSFNCWFKSLSSILCSIYCLAIFTPIGNYQLFSQENNQDNKPKIIFNKNAQKLSNDQMISNTDSTKGKIIFSKDILVKSELITLRSSREFQKNNNKYLIGEKGFNLKNEMVNNELSKSLVDQAYNKQSSGTALMVIGGAIMLAGYILPSTWVELDEQQSGNYVKTWYWLPGVTIGCIIGGIGLSKRSSLTKDLQKAVDKYNEDFVEKE